MRDSAAKPKSSKFCSKLGRVRAAENSSAFHAPQESARILVEAIDLAWQGQLKVGKATKK